MGEVVQESDSAVPVRNYGGPWQEFRALAATVLMGWAHSIHFRCTMGIARGLVEIEDEAAERIERFMDV